MRLTINKSEQVEIEIDFPHFRHDFGYYYAFISQEEMLMVRTHKHSTPEIQHFKSYPEKWLIDGRECTFELFSEAYKQASSEIQIIFKNINNDVL